MSSDSSPADAATLDRIFNECFDSRARLALAARDDFEEDSAERRRRARTILAEDSAEQEALATELIHYSEEVKRTRNRERYVTRTSLGYEDSAEARAERAEAEVAALKDKVAELRERNGKLEGKVEVFERLFSIVEARPKQ